MPYSTVAGAAALDFLNTRPNGPTGPIEKLEAFSDIVDWGRQFDFIDEATASALKDASKAERSAAYRDAIALRESLRDSLEQDSLEATLALANRLMFRRSGHMALVRTGDRLNLQFVGPLTEPSQLVGAIAEGIARFLISEERCRAKKCNGQSCILWFVDRSRNGSRHWCRMDRCGARAKSAAYYRRHRLTAALTKP